MKFRHILAAFAALMLATGCQSTDEAQLLDDPDTVTLIASSGNKFDGRGGNLDILLKSNVNYQVKSDVDWITRNVSRSAAVNGVESFTVAPFPLAHDRTPRKGTVTITYTGLETITYNVEQTPGDIYRFIVKTMTAKNIPAKGGDITFTLDTNTDYTVEVSNPDWITVSGKEASSLTITLAENTTPESRTGSITFKAEAFEPKVVEFSQYGKVTEAGIANADQLMAFAQAVNSGASIDEWLNDDEEIVLTADIDLAGRTWTPIGIVTGSTATNGTVTLGTGNPFKGVFNGQGHTISNLTLSTDNAQFYGFFSVCSGATIKNLKFDASCSLTVANENLTAGSGYGFLAGFIDRTTVDNVTIAGIVKESLMYKGATKYFSCLGGIIGYASSSTISKCRFEGEMKRVRSNVYDNALGSSVGGIVGHSRGAAGAPTTIDGCVNAGTIYAQVNRVGGILAGSVAHYIIRNCENAGVVHANVAEATAAGWASGLRVGGIFGFTSNTNTSYVARIENCVNSGTVVCEADAKTYTAGLVGHIRCITLDNLTNRGTVIGTAGAVGLVLGQLQCADSPTVGTCYVGGRIASAFTGEGKSIQPTSPIAASADNYLEKGVGAITGTNSGHWSATNVHLLTQ